MKNKKGRKCIAIGMLLMVAALFLTMYNLYENQMAGERAWQVTKELDEYYAKLLEADAQEDQLIPMYKQNPGMEMPIYSVGGYDYIGLLEIPSCELRLPVLSDWDYGKLKHAPCRYSGSAYTDNMVIAAHNYRSHFSKIKNIAQGSKIIFTDVDGNIFRYQVLDREILDPEQVEEMKNGDWDLSLFTCGPGGTYRIAVRCILEE